MMRSGDSSAVIARHHYCFCFFCCSHIRILAPSLGPLVEGVGGHLGKTTLPLFSAELTPSLVGVARVDSELYTLSGIICGLLLFLFHTLLALCGSEHSPSPSFPGVLLYLSPTVQDQSRIKSIHEMRILIRHSDATAPCVMTGVVCCSAFCLHSASYFLICFVYPLLSA